MSIHQIHQFLNKGNIQVLWDVLIEEQVIKNFCSSHNKIMELTKIFEANLKGFYDVERKNCDTLVELNKKYILLIINFINSELSKQNKPQPVTPSYQQQPQHQSQFKKIKIHDEQIKQPITFEEIQNERKSQFEKDLQDKQQEFMNSMTLPVPPVPNFSDDLDGPISEIETRIKNIQKQRNYDIELINKNYQNKMGENEVNTNEWLKSENTNIKNEKHISWEDKNNFTENKKTNDSFFSRLKKTSNPIFETSETSEKIVEPYYEPYIPNEEKETISFEIEESDTSNTQNTIDKITDEINYLRNEIQKINDRITILLEKKD